MSGKFGDAFCPSMTKSCFCESILRYRVICDIITYLHMIGDVAMPVSYNKLWKILIDKKMSRSDLKDAAGVSFNVLAKMGKNEFVSMESLYKICVALDCGIDAIMEFTNYEHA